MLENQTHNAENTESPRTNYELTESFHRITDVLKCKWTIAILNQLAQGNTRPSTLQANLPGLTSKVLTERLKKLESFDLLTREVFAEVPPRVEYTLTPRGTELTALLANLITYITRWDDATQ